MRFILVSLLLVVSLGPLRGAPPAAPRTLDETAEHIRERATRQAAGASPGSLYASGTRLTDIFRDLRASLPGDLITIVVSDRASAVTSGTSSAARSSSARARIGALGGPTNPARGLANMVQLGSEYELEGDARTSRENALTTTLSATVVDVLPNGNLIVEGVKEIVVNSERQTVTVRGIVRWTDVTSSNLVRSDRVANLEVRINGRGLVGDAIRRPNFLYRLLLGLMPF